MRHLTAFLLPALLLAVLASPADAFSLNPGKTLIEHWTGSKWTAVSSPTPSGGGLLNGIALDARDDGWAVGFGGRNLQVSKPLIERFNGSKWTVAKAPSSASGSMLSGVAALSPGLAFAVGT